jgi:hypothetical protein
MDSFQHQSHVSHNKKNLFIGLLLHVFVVKKIKKIKKLQVKIKKIMRTCN